MSEHFRAWILRTVDRICIIVYPVDFLPYNPVLWQKYKHTKYKIPETPVFSLPYPDLAIMASKCALKQKQLTISINSTLLVSSEIRNPIKLAEKNHPDTKSLIKKTTADKSLCFGENISLAIFEIHTPASHVFVRRRLPRVLPSGLRASTFRNSGSSLLLSTWCTLTCLDSLSMYALYINSNENHLTFEDYRVVDICVADSDKKDRHIQGSHEQTRV